ncbi:hypothetical protein BSZ35_01160 [Salinibacter sp. 10B]|nr:hypothetical protein BSZ35_01160 [Salinibacter sp. 10B]
MIGATVSPTGDVQVPKRKIPDPQPTLGMDPRMCGRIVLFGLWLATTSAKFVPIQSLRLSKHSTQLDNTMRT